MIKEAELFKEDDERERRRVIAKNKLETEAYQLRDRLQNTGRLTDKTRLGKVQKVRKISISWFGEII